MKEYKVVIAKTPKESEEKMNKYAQKGWIVKEVTFYNTNIYTSLAARFMITFERDMN